MCKVNTGERHAISLSEIKHDAFGSRVLNEKGAGHRNVIEPNDVDVLENSIMFFNDCCVIFKM